MSDTTPNNPSDQPMKRNEDNDDYSKYELITAYIDNELPPEEAEKVRELINTDNNYHNRYLFEKTLKENLKARNKRIETPQYVYLNVGSAIENYIQDSRKQSVRNQNAMAYTSGMKEQKSNLRKYLLAASAAFLFLIAAAFIFNNYLMYNKGLSKEFVNVSRDVYDKVQSGQINLKYKCNNAKMLADSMDKELDFKVFVPDVKDADLVGGVCNEIEGEKFAHIIHKKGNLIIYTLQANKNEMLANEEDEIVLASQFKELVHQGKNWFTCNKEKDKTAVVWVKDNVICSSVSAMESNDIFVILTNYK